MSCYPTRMDYSGCRDEWKPSLNTSFILCAVLQALSVSIYIIAQAYQTFKLKESFKLEGTGKLLLLQL